MIAARALGAILAGMLVTLAAGATADPPAPPGANPPAKPPEAKPAESKNADEKAKAEPAKPPEAKPAESKNAQEKAKAEPAKPPEAKPAESKNAEKKADPKAPPPAPAPAPSLASLFPAGGARGQTVEVTVAGTNLNHAEIAQVSGNGVTAKILEGANAKEARVALTIAADAPTGERDLRLIGPGGVSNRQRVFVGDVPEINEVEPNQIGDTPQAIAALPVLVNGQIMERDRDAFAIPLKAGQVFVADVLGRPIQPFIADGVPAWLEAQLILTDPDGKVVARCEDFRHHPDPLLIYQAPKDGSYRLEIRDELDRGRKDFVYRLRLGTLPTLTGVFPLGGRRGETVSIQLEGANLPADKADVAIPKEAVGRIDYRVERDGVQSNTLPLAVGEHPEITEPESPDGKPVPVPVPVTPPVTINGRIIEPGEQDVYAFEAKAGETVVLDILARRLDSPLDAAITLLAPNGRAVASNDDTIDPRLPLITHQADPHLLYKIPANGTYTVEVRDAQRRGGRDQSYRLTIAPPEPDFALRMTPDNLRMSPGETAMLTVNVLRMDGFPAPIALEVQGLPPGFNSSAATIPTGQDQVSLTITAPADATMGVHSPTIRGSVKVDDREVVRQAEAAESVMQAFTWTHIIPTQGCSLAIVDSPAAPFQIATELGSGEAVRLPRGGEVAVAIRVTRDPNTEGGISITVMGLPPGITAKPVLIAPDQDRGELILSATPRVAPGLSTNLVVRGMLRQGRGSATRVLPAIPLEVIDAPPAP